MPRKPILTAALATGVAISGAHAKQPTDHSEDIIATAPTEAERTGWAADDLLILIDDSDRLTGAPEVVHAPDEWEIGIEYAQTCCGSSRDRISGGARNSNITLDNGIKRNGAITLDNGLKKGGKIKLNNGGSGNRAKGNRKKRKRK